MKSKSTGEFPSVYAVIVHHRGADLLEASIGSLLRSEGVDLQVIIVANACEELIPEDLRLHPAVHVVESTHPLGFSTANNLAVRWSQERLGRPDWYYFLNNDTVSTESALRQMIEEVQLRPDCGIVGPRLMILGAEGYLNSLGLNLTTFGEAWDEGIGTRLDDYGPLAPSREVLALTGSALLVRVDVLQSLGGWTELYDYYYEDLDLCLRARSRGISIVQVTTAVVHHMISATSDDGSQFKRYQFWRNRFLLLTTHWPWGLLLRTTPKIVAAEIAVLSRRLWIREVHDARLQVRSWLGALRRLPEAIRHRRKLGPVEDWTEQLFPPGSVPEIILPRPTPPASAREGSARVDR